MRFALYMIDGWQPQLQRLRLGEEEENQILRQAKKVEGKKVTSNMLSIIITTKKPHRLTA
jgi:hypothetical protein